MRTNRTVLYKGLRLMFITLIMMFIGPSLLYVALSNQGKPLYIPILIASLLICGGAIFMGFKGIRTILSSMFDQANSD